MLLLYNFYVLVLTLYSFYTHLICQIRIKFDFARIFCQSYVHSNVYSYYVLSYRYTIAFSGLFELYTRGGHLNQEAKLSGLKLASSVQSNKPR